MIKRFVPRLVAFVLLTWSGAALAIDDASCKFDPQKISLTDVVQLYSCVPIADGLCAKTCGEKSISTGINTEIRNGRIGQTTLLCQGSKIGKETWQNISVDGLTDKLVVSCAAPAQKPAK